MRVAFDYQIFSAQKNGGISRYFCNLMQNLNDDNDLTINLPITTYENEYLKEIEALLNIKNTKKNNFNFLRSNSNSNYEITKNFLYSQKFDILHATYYDDYFVNLIQKKPFVITIHDMIYETFPELFSLKDNLSQLKKYLAQKADKVIVVSESTKKDLLKFVKIDEKKIDVIPLASSFSIDKVVKHTNRGKYLLYVGNRSIYKNFYFMLSSIKDLLRDHNDLKLICFGGKFDKKEEAFLQNLQIADKVELVTGEDDTLIDLYKNALALIFPSYYEGFGIPIVEAFSCGCPIISSTSKSLMEVAQNAAIYFDPKDNRAIQDTVEKVINDENLRKNLINMGFERNKAFSWKETAQKTKQTYQSIL